MLGLAFNPCGNFSDTSSLKLPIAKGSIGHAFTVCIHTENQNQVSFYPFVPREISVLTELTLGPRVLRQFLKAGLAQTCLAKCLRIPPAHLTSLSRKADCVSSTGKGAHLHSVDELHPFFFFLLGLGCRLSIVTSLSVVTTPRVASSGHERVSTTRLVVRALELPCILKVLPGIFHSRPLTSTARGVLATLLQAIPIGV